MVAHMFFRKEIFSVQIIVKGWKANLDSIPEQTKEWNSEYEFL
jgi:hypothetical protein